MMYHGESGLILYYKGPPEPNGPHLRRSQGPAKDASGILLRVASDSSTFERVASAFQDSWKHTDRKLKKVRYIYEIKECFAPGSRDSFDTFLQKKGYSMKVGNNQYLWHGTSRKCAVGDDAQNAQLCHDSDCALCQIMRTGYHTEHALSSGLFGKGIYATSVSSKAAKYAKSASRSKYKVVLYNRVVVGKSYCPMGPLADYTSPPSGYDSVYGTPGVTTLGPNRRALAFDETVVYTTLAMHPTYMVVFAEE
ncbi:hypothetical protein B0H11DRAFT_2107222 [Mycena galericulata]|nr:hypothetical protein B0H11DRAFT_2107222 [Mycena galericulata]